MAASTFCLCFRRLIPKEAWLLVFFALVLTADFMRAADGVVSVGPVRDRVRLLGAEQAAPGAVLQRDVAAAGPGPRPGKLEQGPGSR